jgi:adenine deaminase
MKTIRRGKLVVQNGIPLFGVDQPSVINNFRANQLTVEDIALRCSEQYGNVISVLDGKLETERIVRPLACNDFHLVGDRMNDVLKIVCLDRYGRQRLGIGLVHGFGLQRGAMASSVSHDAHNIVAVGTNDDDIIAAVNQVVAAKGGISVANGNMQHCLELPILGLMSNKGHVEVAERYMDLLGIAKDRDSLASPLRDPFMTLSFMCLEVIGDLKLTPFGMVTLGKTGFEQVPTLQQCA